VCSEWIRDYLNVLVDRMLSLILLITLSLPSTRGVNSIPTLFGYTMLFTQRIS